MDADKLETALWKASEELNNGHSNSKPKAATEKEKKLNNEHKMNNHGREEEPEVPKRFEYSVEVDNEGGKLLFSSARKQFKGLIFKGPAALRRFVQKMLTSLS